MLNKYKGWLPALYFFLLWSPCILFAADSKRTESIDFWQTMVFSTIFWLLWVALAKKLWLALTLALPFALVLPFELWIRHSQGEPISSHFLAVLVESNLAESINFFSAYGLYLTLLIVICISFYLVAIYMAHIYDTKWMHRSRYWVLAVFIPAIGLFSLSFGSSNEELTNFSNTVLDEVKLPALGVQWEKVYPISLWVSIYSYRQQQHRLDSLRDVMSQRRLNARQLSEEAAPEIVVLVIGESASAAHWGALGYERDTTPLVQSMDGIAIFSDVVALSNATRKAIPGVISRKPILTPNGSVDWDAEPSIVQAFKEVGYSTHWISNQAPLGVHDTAISVYAREAEDVRFLNPSTYANRTSDDSVLLAHFQSILQMPGRHLIVLHLLGSHFDYALRFPREFDQFQPSSLGKVTPTAEQINNSYDNSILYTDHLLAQMISLVEKRDVGAIVSYFSDHGVDPNIGACASQSAGRRSEFTYHVPAFFWLSKKMREQKTENFNQLIANRQQPYTTRAIYSTILDLTGIVLEGGGGGENFLHASSFRRIIGTPSGAYVDFDEAKMRNKCLISAG